VELSRAHEKEDHLFGLGLGDLRRVDELLESAGVDFEDSANSQRLAVLEVENLPHLELVELVVDHGDVLRLLHTLRHFCLHLLLRNEGLSLEQGRQTFGLSHFLQHSLKPVLKELPPCQMEGNLQLVIFFLQQPIKPGYLRPIDFLVVEFSGVLLDVELDGAKLLDEGAQVEHVGLQLLLAEGFDERQLFV
jgi:hypothetical protein